MPLFLEALFGEMALTNAQWPDPFDTCYIGGGTPSLLSAPQFTSIFEHIRRHFVLVEKVEITVEANPESLSGSLCGTLLELGVNRLSIGVQSMSARELELMGRYHTVSHSRDAVAAARSAGFDNLSIDLIYGLPGQSLRDWEQSLSGVLALEPEHISAYTLTCHADTPLTRSVKNGDVILPDDGLVSDMFMAAHETLTGAGYRHYEISNFALPGYTCRHNTGYWDHTPYLGLGPSAHSFAGATRSWNVSDSNSYIARLNSHALPVDSREILTDDQLRLETIALGLRTKEGIPIDCDSVLKVANQVEDEGLGAIDNGRFCPSAKGFLLADEMALLFGKSSF